jgi:hypothetical protein
MPINTPKIMPLAAALATLAGMNAVVANPAEAKTATPAESTAPNAGRVSDVIPNYTISTGKDFLGFIVTTAADGTMLAEHYSHTSHASHSSHSSHYSSR